MKEYKLARPISNLREKPSEEVNLLYGCEHWVLALRVEPGDWHVAGLPSGCTAISQGPGEQISYPASWELICKNVKKKKFKKWQCLYTCTDGHFPGLLQTRVWGKTTSWQAMCRHPTASQGTGILRPGDRCIFTTSFSIFLTVCFNCNSTIQTSEIMSHLLACIRSTRSNAV